MPYLNPRILDLGLNVLDTEATHLHICTSEPASFAAVAGVSLGAKASLDIGAPATAGTGRKVTVAAITTGMTASATGTATHYAIVDQANSRLLAASALEDSQAITSGNPRSGKFRCGQARLRLPPARSTTRP